MDTCMTTTLRGGRTDSQLALEGDQEPGWYNLQDISGQNKLLEANTFICIFFVLTMFLSELDQFNYLNCVFSRFVQLLKGPNNASCKRRPAGRPKCPLGPVHLPPYIPGPKSFLACSFFDKNYSTRKYSQPKRTGNDREQQKRTGRQVQAVRDSGALACTLERLDWTGTTC